MTELYFFLLFCLVVGLFDDGERMDERISSIIGEIF